MAGPTGRQYRRVNAEEEGKEPATAEADAEAGLASHALAEARVGAPSLRSGADAEHAIRADDEDEAEEAALRAAVRHQVPVVWQTAPAPAGGEGPVCEETQLGRGGAGTAEQQALVRPLHSRAHARCDR